MGVDTDASQDDWVPQVSTDQQFQGSTIVKSPWVLGVGWSIAETDVLGPVIERNSCGQ